MSNRRISRGRNRSSSRSRSPSSTSSGGKSYSSFSSGGSGKKKNEKQLKSRKMSSSSASWSSFSSQSGSRSRSASRAKRLANDGTYSMSDLSDDGSFLSFDSNASYSSSRANSLRNLQDDYQPVGKNLPLNVYQILLSIKNSMVNVYKLRRTYQVNATFILTKLIFFYIIVKFLIVGQFGEDKIPC
jgi:hypothetical protein